MQENALLAHKIAHNAIVLKIVLFAKLVLSQFQFQQEYAVNKVTIA